MIAKSPNLNSNQICLPLHSRNKVYSVDRIVVRTYNSSVGNCAVVCDELKLYWSHDILHHAGPILRCAALVAIRQKPPFFSTVPGVHVRQQKVSWVADVASISLLQTQALIDEFIINVKSI